MGDVDALRSQYADDRYLRIRQQIHDQYTVPRVDFASWVLDRADWQATSRVLDVGTGSGVYYPMLHKRNKRLHYIGVDNSAGMLTHHQAMHDLLLADALKLPFASGTFDVVMAHHMLFHVQDIEAAIDEFRRVLKPRGILMTATNSIQTMPEFQALFRRALLLLSNYVRPNSPYLLPPHNAFTLENGVRRLARHFYAVVRYDLPSMLVFPEIDPVMEYLNSLRGLREEHLPPDVTWDSLMEAMYDQVQRVITLQGELVVSKLSGVLVASDSGGFIGEYCDYLEKSRATGKKGA
ncbi:MAG: class I SAM-dependent methyltransferase [Chloroflexota bacterium]|nr:class I SAM-dependent methyltransferase [Chloroflexota bacterium]